MRDVGLNSFQTADQANSPASKLSENTYGLAKRYDQNQLSQLLCLGPTWVWETDADHRFSFISPKMEDVTGIKVKDLIGRTRRDSFFGSAGLSPSMIAHLDDLNSQRPFNDFAFRSSKSDGAALWVTISGFPRFDEDGKFLGYTGVSRALSDQAFIDSGLKTATEQLSRVETVMENIFSSVPVGIALWDTQGNLQLCNQNFRDMIAINVDFKVGETYETIIRRVLADNQIVKPKGSLTSWLDKDLRAMLVGAQIEDIYQLSDGRWILRRVQLNQSGERVDIRADITEIKNKEQATAVALEEAMLAQSVVNGLSEPVFVKDSDLNFVFCNDAFGAIMNTSATAFPKKRASDFVTSNEAQAFEASEKQVLEKGDTFELQEDHFEDGVQKTRILRKSRITTTSGKHYVAGYMFDITALRQREHALLDASRRAASADKAKSDFLAQMSHEIRTPMNGVLSMTELLVQSTLDERQRVFVDIIRKSGESLLSTINTILDFTRIENGTLALESNAFQLRTAVEDVAEMLVTKAAAKETDIILDIEPDLPASLIGDEGRLRQIISNLLTNAIKFTENGQIKITLKGQPMPGGKLNLALTVSDTGMGIPADKLDQIFDRFAQISNRDASKQEGTGLGLSIVAKLAKMMGGLCRVQSVLGKGSVFYVDLPMGCADMRAPSTPVSDALRAKRVLIIDADAQWRASLIKPLKHWGFDVAAVEGPQTAIAMAHALHSKGQLIDLVLIGCNAPIMSCLDIGHMLDSQWPCRPAVKLLLAPLNATVPAQTMTKLNVHSMLTLPVKQAALYHHVVSALQAEAEPLPIVAPVAPTAKSERAGLARVDVLIAEDNSVNQLVMTQILSGTGLSYQIVANGQLAVEAFEDMQPSLVLMDIGMPLLNGFEATKAIRAMTSFGGDTVPIIAVTASAAGEDREACLNAGMNDHLAKPISPEALLSKIAQWMPKRLSKTA